MLWLRELARKLSGQELLTAVETHLFERCQGSRCPARDDPHWTTRARALIGTAGLSHRLRADFSAPLVG